MQTSSKTVFMQLATVAILLSAATAQQTPAASSQPSTSQGASQSASGAPKTPATSATKKAPVGAKAAAPVLLKTQKDKESYALGMKIGADLGHQGASGEVDPALVGRGLRDALAGSKTLLTEDEQRAALMQLRTAVQQKMEAQQKVDEAKAHQQGLANRKEGETFLAANKAKDGVVTLPSGLQYKIMTAGNGPKPTASDTVVCNYRGTLLNGKEFDSSYKRGEPASFPVDHVIKGWTEALQLMPVGSKWQLFIPTDMAYGDDPPPGIDPGDTLIFEVELLSIADQKSQEQKK
jgi:FKBP-type peptidyl-prolyl cis-trans isomerase